MNLLPQIKIATLHCFNDNNIKVNKKYFLKHNFINCNIHKLRMFNCCVNSKDIIKSLSSMINPKQIFIRFAYRGNKFWNQ